MVSIVIFTSLNEISHADAQQYLFSYQWGSHGDNNGQFEEPTGIGIDSSDNVYVSDTDFEDCCNPLHHTVQKFMNDGTFITKWGGNGAFINPWGIALDSSGSVYVADQVHQRIAKFTSDGVFILDWASQINPTDIAIDSSDNVYVTEMFDSRIAKFTSDGTLIQKWNTGPLCRGIAVDSSDNIWVTSANNGDTNYLVQQFTSDGNLLTQWNSAGNDGVNIPGFNGYGIAFDSEGKLFITDTFNHRIQKYETDGTLITQFGILGTANGEFNTPLDVSIDSQGKIFVTDPFNHRVQVFAQNSAPIAQDIDIKIKKNKPVEITLSATDADGDPVTFSIETGPLHGTITNFNPSTGTLIYTPEKKFTGEDEFTFKATDDNGQDSNIATVSILVNNKPLKFLLGSILSSLGFN
ncbi:MAG: Ig-like domain-containing protein [Nitrososphaeraceae archaeon]|nr:Ig-like domain-containing protein [Nitrososphaeraceae archaeon]